MATTPITKGYRIGTHSHEPPVSADNGVNSCHTVGAPNERSRLASRSGDPAAIKDEFTGNTKRSRLFRRCLSRPLLRPIVLMFYYIFLNTGAPVPRSPHPSLRRVSSASRRMPGRLCVLLLSPLILSYIVIAIVLTPLLWLCQCGRSPLSHILSRCMMSLHVSPIGPGALPHVLLCVHHIHSSHLCFLFQRGPFPFIPFPRA